MTKYLALVALLFAVNTVSAAPVTTLKCTVAKTKETFSLKVKINGNRIEEVIADADDNVVVAKEDSDVSYLAMAELSELQDGSQVFETDMDGIEKYSLVLSSKSGFTKGVFELEVWDTVTSSNKSYKSSVACTKK